MVDILKLHHSNLVSANLTTREWSYVSMASFKKTPNKIRVVVVTDSMQPWNFGGKEERLRHFKNSFERNPGAGFEIYYATMKWWDDQPPENHFAISKLRPMYFNGRRSLRQALFFALACFKVIRFRPDIVEADQIPILPLYILKIVTIVTRSSFSVTWHEVWDKETWSAYLGRFGRLASKLEHFAIRLPNQIVAVSVPTRFKLICAGAPEEKIVLIEPDIDRDAISRAETKLPASDLLFAGRIIGNKNLDIIVQAIALLAKENISVSASFIGDGPELSNLVNLVSTLGIRDQVTFHGFLPRNEDVWGLMKKCSIFISPSTREGFGFSVMEAHFAGANIIIADHPNNAATYYLSELDGVTTVKGSNPQVYADVIKSLVSKMRSVSKGSDLETLNIYEKYAKSWAKLLSVKKSAS